MAFPKGGKRFNYTKINKIGQSRRIALTTFAVQNKIIDAIRSGKYLYIAMGGGIRSSKTFCMLIAITLLCRIFPGSRWAIVRKDLQTLRRNVLPSYEKLRINHCPDFLGEFNKSEWIATCKNGSQIILFAESFNIDPDLERWKGLEVNGFLLEEASELNEQSKHKAVERAGSWIIPDLPDGTKARQPPPFVFFTFNPCANWPKMTFYEPHKANTLLAPYFYLPATEKDNPYVPDAVREAWKNLPPNLYARFVLGEWNFTDDPDQLIKYEWIQAAFNREPDPNVHIANRVGADIARYGDDTTVFAGTEGPQLTKIEEHAQIPLDKTAQLLMLFCQSRTFMAEASNVKVDGVGLGGGVVDFCRGKGFHVQDLIAGAKPIERKRLNKNITLFKFKNLRSQMWWEFAEQLRTETDICFGDLPDDVRVKLVADLTAVKYSIDGDKVITIESKDDIKKRLGRSTDVGDAIVQAYFEMPSNMPSALSVFPGGSAMASPFAY